jgi:hypothetical protein
MGAEVNGNPFPMQSTAITWAPRSTTTLLRTVNANSMGAEINGALLPHADNGNYLGADVYDTKCRV